MTITQGRAISNPKFRIVLFIAATLSGCAAMREVCRDSVSPSNCQTKLVLAVLSCESEAKRLTPVINIATGNYLCDGTASQNGNSHQYQVTSTCRTEFKQTQNKAVLDSKSKVCLQAKIDAGLLK